jgi:hypothetical protein
MGRVVPSPSWEILANLINLTAINMKKWVILGSLLLLMGCGDSFKYEDFSSSESAKGTKEFQADSKICLAEKDKHINKIQGREFGFKGRDTGYLGCMKLRGWDKKTSP